MIFRVGLALYYLKKFPLLVDESENSAIIWGLRYDPHEQNASASPDDVGSTWEVIGEK